jgi:hypothetical protein
MHYTCYKINMIMGQYQIQLWKACQKGACMNCWEALYIQIFHQRKVLITEQQVNDNNPPLRPCEHNTNPST